MADGNQVAVITGAASGIGRATALRFARAGARLVLNDVAEVGLDETATMCRAEGAEALAAPGDVADRGVVDGLVEEAVATYGGLDAMVANAGIALDQPFLEVTEEALDRTLAVNLKGVFFCGQAAARTMITAGTRGAIVNVASTFAEVCVPDCSAYCASKGGVRMLTKAMALELGGHGIRVNAVAPGYIRTGMNPLTDPDENRRLEATIPLGHIASPDQVAGVIHFLTIQEASYMTGETVFVDGGWVLR